MLILQCCFSRFSRALQSHRRLGDAADALLVGWLAGGYVLQKIHLISFSVAKWNENTQKEIFNRKNIGKIYCSSSRQRFIDGVEERLFNRGSPCLVNYSKKKNEHVLVHATAMLLPWPGPAKSSSASKQSKAKHMTCVYFASFFSLSQSLVTESAHIF